MHFSGERLLHYEVVEPIADGGTGIVYKAVDTRADRLVALLVLRPEHLADPGLMRLFEERALAAAGLSHPNIATVYDITSEGPFTVVVMEYLPDYTPLGRLSGERFTPSDTLRYAIPLVGAIAAGHSAGVVHGGLTPSSIMLADQGRVKVLHFGLAAIADGATLSHAIDARPSSSVVNAGDSLSEWEPYFSPEHVLGEIVDERSDVFSLGAILYEMLTGVRPFGGDSPESARTALVEHAPAGTGNLAGVPDALDAIVMRCLHKDRDARFPSASALLSALEACRTEPEGQPNGPRDQGRARTRVRPLYVVAAAALLTIAAGYSVRAYQRYRGAAWAATDGIAEVVDLADAGRIADAFAVATRVESFLPSTPLLRESWPVLARELTIDTIPAGADVFRKAFDAPGEVWQGLGRTPLQTVRVPRDLSRWRIERAGFATIEGTLTDSTDGAGPDALRITLDRLEETPAGMVRVRGGTERRLELFGHDGLPPRALADYWIDRYEVTNRQFKLFIDGGGYQQRELWTHPIVRAGAALPWHDAAAEFRDTTGRPAPASWADGEFPEAQADHPVAGVSWYEASAYCASVGKSLPTVWHWSGAAGIRTSASIVPASNFGGGGPAQVGRFPGLGPWGTYDMAGNVWEWSLNPASPELRYVLGGASGEPAHAFQRAEAMDPLTRRPNIGFRCVKYTSESEPGTAAELLAVSNRDYARERPCSDELFRFLKSLYGYESKPLNATVENLEGTRRYRAERISFDAAYGAERVVAYLFLPAAAAAPLQTVVVIPGSELFRAASPAAFAPEFLLKSGRAVLIPVLKGTFERRDGYVSDVPSMSPQYRDRIVEWGKDVRRSVEYLRTRPDLDSRKFGYYGSGLGAQLGPIMSVVEDGFSATVWAHGGLKPQYSLPEVDAFHFAPRVRVPTLMLGTRFDFAYPLELSQLPLFQSVGMPADRKRLAVVETTGVPLTVHATPTLEWLDRYLGPVR